MVDQLTAALTGAYDHPVVKTPNLNRLVSEDVRFDAAYSNCPVCGPARGALMTGRYVSNCKVYDNAAAWPEDQVTIPHYLTLAGYDTVLSVSKKGVKPNKTDFSDILDQIEKAIEK